MPMGAINHNQGWNQMNRWTVEKFMRDGGLLSEVYLMWMRWEVGWDRERTNENDSKNESKW